MIRFLYPFDLVVCLKQVSHSNVDKLRRGPHHVAELSHSVCWLIAPEALPPPEVPRTVKIIVLDDNTLADNKFAIVATICRLPHPPHVES